MKYRVNWNRIVCCQSIVDAENELDAIRIATQQSDPDQTEDGGDEDINVETADENDD